MTKTKVAIVTDSVANLTPETIAEHNIYVIPQILNWEGQSLLDQIDITVVVEVEKTRTREGPGWSHGGRGFDEFESTPVQEKPLADSVRMPPGDEHVQSAVPIGIHPLQSASLHAAESRAFDPCAITIVVEPNLRRRTKAV